MLIDFDKTIKADKVFLRPIKEDDFNQMKSMTQNADMWYYFTADLSKESVLKEWINDAVSDLKNKKSLPFTIISSETGEIIGTTRIGNISEVDKRVEIGWTWIAEKYQGTGINRLVKKLLFQYLFTETEVIRIEFKTDILNIAARKSMEKVGLIEEGVLRSHTLMINNRRRDTIYYSILRDEWLEHKK